VARVVLTQPLPRVEALAERLRARGHETLALGLTRIVERLDDAQLRDAIARLSGFDWVVLVSPAAALAAARLAPEWPANVGVAVVGPGSRAALADAGFRRAPVRVLAPDAPPYDGDALAARLANEVPPAARVLVLRGETGSEAWIRTLREGGAQVQVCAAYRHEPVEPRPDALARLRSWLESGDAGAPCFVVTQASSVGRLERVLRGAGLHERAKRAPALAIHPRIADALRDAGWSDVRQVDPGEAALMLALESASHSSSR